MKRESVLNLISVLVAVISAIVSLIGVGIAKFPGKAHVSTNITFDRTILVIGLVVIAVSTAICAAIIRLSVHREVSHRDQKNHDIFK
jgi:uncharacterized membrane protein YidH (DUF202 family)